MASSSEIDAAAQSIAEYVGGLVDGDQGIKSSLGNQYRKWLEEAAHSSLHRGEDPEPSGKENRVEQRSSEAGEVEEPGSEKDKRPQQGEAGRVGRKEVEEKQGVEKEKNIAEPVLQGACVPLEEDGSHGNVAYVELDLSGEKLALKVVCPRFLRLRRTTYVKAVGYALHLVEEAQGPQSLKAFTLQMHPRPQLNLVIAIGCLGYFVSKANAKELQVREAWPTSTASSPDTLPDPHLFQFQTVWYKQKFLTSYYDLVDSEFKWIQRPSLFEADVTAQKKRNSLSLRYLDLAALHHENEDARIYLEYNRHDGARISFFGTVGDVIAKYDLLKEGSFGQRQLASSRAYYIPRTKHLVIVALLNKKRQPPMPILTVENVEWLPEPALKNLAKLWTPKTYKLMLQRQKSDPTFLGGMFKKVPPKVKVLLSGGAKDPSTRGILALSLYSNLMER